MSARRFAGHELGGRMLKIFGLGKVDHPLADPKEARRIFEAAAADDSFKALEELGHWFDSVAGTEGFRPEQRTQLCLQIDDVAQAHLRKLSREYLSSARPSKFQENRLWGANHGYWQRAAAAHAGCVDALAAAKGFDAGAAALSCARALRALAQEIKWQYMRYGPHDDTLWQIAGRLYALSEQRGMARHKVTVYTAISGESSPEQEFLRSVMLSACSPDALLPLEMELAERLIAHFSSSFSISATHQADTAYWIDLAAAQPPQRLARPPQPSPTLRFFSASGASQELQALAARIKLNNAVPGNVNLGGSYEASMTLDVLDHLALYWSPMPPERKTQRHRVKTRLAVVHGLEGVLGTLGMSDTLDFGATAAESWIVENVSAGGFGALVPHIQGEWLKIGCLLALQPEGGDNWLLGVVRRFSRDTPQQGSVGIQTLARSLLPARLVIAGTEESGIVLDAPGIESASEARVLLKPGVYVPGQNMEFEHGGQQVLLLPLGISDSGDDYDVVRCRPMLRDTGE